MDLDDEMEGAAGMASVFTEELRELRGALAAAGTESDALSRTMSRSLSRAFEAVVFDGGNASDALRGVAQSLADTVYRSATKPVADHLGGLVSDGLSGLVGKVVPFAKGGVVSAPTTFPMQGATGLMGEAGPEAIMPLTRGPDGSLGVRAQGGAAPQVTINISTPDVEGFRRSQSQIAAQASRALGRGSRNR